MRNKKMVFLCIAVILLLVFPMIGFAQVDLTETYTTPDGKFSISYPAGYEVNDESEDLIGIRGSAGLFQINFYDNNGSGYAPVTAMEYLGVAIGEDELTRSMFEYNEPEEVTVAGFVALRSSSSMMNELHVVIDFGDGVLGNAIGFATDLGSSEPVFMAMLNSIQYGDGPQETVVENPIDSAEPITSANASQVAQMMTLGDAGVAVTAVAFNFDNRVLAIGTEDGTVQLWDSATGENRFTLEGNSGGVTSLAFGAGTYMLAVGTGDGQVRLWDTATGEASGTQQSHDAAVTSVAFQLDGFLIASGAADGSVMLSDISQSAEMPALVEPDQVPVGGLAFSLDGMLLAAGGGSSIRVWDTSSWELQAELETEISGIASVSFTPDATALIYGGADPAVWMWDIADNNQVLLNGNVGTVSSLAFTLESNVIASADDEAVRLWDAVSGASLATLAGSANSVAFKPDGTLLASGGATGGAVLWSTSGEGGTGQVPTTADTAPEPTPAVTATEETTTAAATEGCTINVPNEVNLRSGPGTTFDRAGTLSAGQTVEVDGQTQGADGMAWYRLATGEWVRSDVVGSPAACANVPAVSE